MGRGNRSRGGLRWILAYLSASPSSWKILQSTRSIINKPKEHILPWSWILLELRSTATSPGFYGGSSRKIEGRISLFELILCHVTFWALLGASRGQLCHVDLRIPEFLELHIWCLKCCKFKIFQHKFVKFWILFILRTSADRNSLPKRYKTSSVFSG